jgi:hypothetical protein
MRKARELIIRSENNPSASRVPGQIRVFAFSGVLAFLLRFKQRMRPTYLRLASTRIDNCSREASGWSALHGRASRDNPRSRNE